MKFVTATAMILVAFGVVARRVSAETTLAPTATATYRVLPQIRLWSGEAPGTRSWPGRSTTPVRETASADGAAVANVVDPTIQPYLPDPKAATGAAVIIAPGGGFRFLSIENEGQSVAEWLARRGIAAFVLKYRLVQRPDTMTDEGFRQRVQSLPVGSAGAPAAADGIQALKLIRSRAGEFGIDPRRIGAIGFSAGGHVVAMMGLNPVASERPDFVGEIYGAPFLAKMPDLPPANLPPPPGAPKKPWLAPPPKPAPGALPPFFMAMAQDDVVVGQGFRQFYDAMVAAGYRPELHLYLRGGHGFGMARRGETTDPFIDEFYWWLEAQGLTKAAAPR